MKKYILIIAIAMLAIGARAEDISVPIPEQTVTITTSNIVVDAARGVAQNPNTGTWVVTAKVTFTGQGRITTNGVQKTFISNMILEISVTRAEIAAHYSVTLEQYDDLTIKQLRDAVWAIAPTKAIQSIQTPITGS